MLCLRGALCVDEFNKRMGRGICIVMFVGVSQAMVSDNIDNDKVSHRLVYSTNHYWV